MNTSPPQTCPRLWTLPSRTKQKLSVWLLVLGSFIAGHFAPAQQVTSTADSGAGSLRTVVAAAQPYDVITFAPGLSGQTILLISGEIVLSNSIKIDASNLPGGIRINGNHASRIFRVVSGASVNLHYLTLTNGFANAGGAILNGGDLTLVGCSIVGNSVSSGGGGGGIYNNLGKLSLLNCTVAHNSANLGGGAGGGIFNLSGGAQVLLEQSTVTGNQAATGGGFASFNVGSNNVVLANSIIAGNGASAGSDLHNTTPSLRGTNLINGNPRLAPLGNYGGPTPTMPPLFGSPAMDGGDDAFYPTIDLPFDQRLVPRRAGTRVDIGAVESQLLVVTNHADSGPGSLRDTVAAATQANVINFAAHLSGQTIQLTSGLIPLNQTLAIDASGLPGGITLSGGHASQILTVGPGAHVTLLGLTFTAGTTAGAGGAIYTAAGSTLHLARCTFTGNSALEGGALLNDGVLSIENSTFSGNSSGYGGGLQCRAPTSLSHCTISGNHAYAGGGGVFNKWSTLTVNNSIIADNLPAMDGRDIYSQLAALVFTNANLVSSIVEDNPSATTIGPAPLTSPPLLAPLGNYDGPNQTMPPLFGSPAIDLAPSTSLTIDQRGAPRVIGKAADLGASEFYLTNTSTIVTTTADTGAGSLRYAIAYTRIPSPLTVTFAPNLAGQTILLTNGQIVLDYDVTMDASELPGGIRLDGNHATRLFLVQPSTTVVMNSLSLINGFARGADGPAGSAGGDGLSGQGGGIYNAGTLTLNQVTLTNNSAIGGNGGRATSNFGKGGTGGDGQGGGIYNAGTLTLNRSTLAHAAATGGRGGQANFGDNAGGAGQGGAVFNVGILTLNQATLTGNSATGGFGGDTDGGCGGFGVAGNGQGGGIYNAGSLVVRQATVAGNFATPGVLCGTAGTGQGGGICSTNTFSLFNSIVAGNVADSGTNIFGGFTSFSSNLTSGNPGLAALGHYGGPTQTLPPLPGSPALDAGDDSATNTFATDQRGSLRRSGLHVDLGAVEVLVSSSQPSVLTGLTRLENGAFQFGFTNLVGASFTVFATTNVSHPPNAWSNLGPALETSPGQFQFTDPQATNGPQRFYRVRSP